MLKATKKSTSTKSPELARAARTVPMMTRKPVGTNASTTVSLTASINFKVGDKAVYPAHGVGVIKGIESRDIGGSKLDFYVLQILSSGATLMVPTDGCVKAGMREVISDEEIENVYVILRSPGKVTQTTWNRRFREFNDKLRTGSLSDVAEVLRDLNSLKGDKDLSFGEKRMLDKARSMIVAEISAARARSEAEVEGELDQILFPN